MSKYGCPFDIIAHAQPGSSCLVTVATLSYARPWKSCLYKMSVLSVPLHSLVFLQGLCRVSCGCVHEPAVKLLSRLLLWAHKGKQNCPNTIIPLYGQLRYKRSRDREGNTWAKASSAGVELLPLNFFPAPCIEFQLPLVRQTIAPGLCSSRAPVGSQGLKRHTMETGPRFKDNKKTTEGILTHMQDFTIAALIWGKRISACGQATSPFFLRNLYLLH